MQFETSRYENGLFYFEPGQEFVPAGRIETTLAQDKMIPLRTLVAINPGEVLATANDDSVGGLLQPGVCRLCVFCERKITVNGWAIFTGCFWMD